MVTITDGNKTRVVSKGAFHALFENSGWVLEGDYKDEKSMMDNLPDEDEKMAETDDLPPLKQPQNIEEDYEDDEDDEDIEIPISDMTIPQLKQYAKEHDINVSHAENKKQLRSIIEDAIM